MFIVLNSRACIADCRNVEVREMQGSYHTTPLEL